MIQKKESEVLILKKSLREREEELERIKQEFKKMRDEWESRLQYSRRGLEVTNRELAKVNSRLAQVNKELEEAKANLEEKVRERTKDLEERTTELEKSRTALMNMLEEVEKARKETKKAYEIEKKAREEIEHLSEVKDQFLLATQHHLRTPLTIMKGYLSVLLAKKQELDLKTKEDYIEKTLNSTNRLIKLVNELLDIAKFQVGKQPLNFQPTNIKNIIEDILKELQGEIQIKKLNVKILPQNEKNWPLILADSEKLEIVFSNIIDNAVKYTPQQGEITIQTKIINNSFQISIQDTGIGINPEEIPSLFTRYFERGEQAQKIYTTGRGIGLFIANNIIKAHNGRIWAESEGIGKGTKFVIELKMRG